MARCSRNQMPERHSLSLSLNIHGSVQQKSKYYARKAQSILHVAYIWLVTEEIKCQEGRRSLSSMLDIHDSVQQNSNRPGRHRLYPLRSIYMVQCIRNQMLGTHSLSQTLNIHGSVQQKSNAEKAQSIIYVEYKIRRKLLFSHLCLCPWTKTF